MSAEAHRAGHALIAVFQALIVTGVSLAVLLTLQLVADDIAKSNQLYPGEILSTLLYLLIMGTALTIAFGTIPFATVILVLMKLRTTSIAAFALGGALAGAVAVAAFLLVTARGFDAAMEEFRKLALQDLSGVAVIAASILGALVARRYLIRRNELGT